MFLNWASQWNAICFGFKEKCINIEAWNSDARGAAPPLERGGRRHMTLTIIIDCTVLHPHQVVTFELQF